MSATDEGAAAESVVIPTGEGTPPDTNGSGAGDSETSSNLFEVYKAEGNGLVKADKLDEALEKYNLAWNECRNDDDRAMILNNKGVVADKKGDTEEAIKMFTDALATKSGYIKVLIRRGLAYKKLKRYDEALEDVTEAHVLALKQQQVLEGFQESVVSQLLLDIVDDELQKLQAERTFPFPKNYYIKTHFRQYYCDPISRFWKGLDLSPVDEFKAAQGDATPELNGFLAALDCMKKDKFSEVPDHCTEEINDAAGKYRLEALLLRGTFHLLSGSKDEAEKDFKSVIEDPNASDKIKSCAHLKAALLMNLWSTAEEAAGHFSDAEQLWKENADIYYHAALCLVDKGEAFPALALLEKGVELCPEPKQNPLLHILCLTLKMTYNLSFESPQITVGKLKDIEASGVFDTPECYEFYAQTLLLFDSVDAAFAQFDQATKLSDGEKLFELKKVMAQHILSNEPEKTLKSLEPYCEDPVFSATAWYHIGEMNTILGNKDAALEAIDKSIDQCVSIYDAKTKIMGRADFKYSYLLSDKMKKYGLDLTPDDALKNCSLE